MGSRRDGDVGESKAGNEKEKGLRELGRTRGLGRARMGERESYGRKDEGRMRGTSKAYNYSVRGGEHKTCPCSCLNVNV